VQTVPEFASFDGVKIHYEVEGEGPPVVLLHGIIATAELNWRAPGIWKALVDAGMRVIGPDARGHGSSEKPHDPHRYNDDAMARDVSALFDHLGLERADVVGYSMGAAVSMRFAGRDDRIRRLVLGGFSGRFRNAEAVDEADARSRFRAVFEAEDEDSIDPTLIPFRRFAVGSGADMDALRALVRSNAFDGGFDASKVYPPTLVVCGDEDVSPYELAESLPDGRARLISGNHFAAVLDPALATEIVSFLRVPNGT
jgi:pimeloyl-ACP methyl ester carboxylesterase